MRAGWWWIDRWRKSTAYTDMTLAEQGAYRNLLDELWLRGGVIPNDERILAKISGDARGWKKVRAAVLARFRETPDGLCNDTHDEVMETSRKQSERQQRYRDSKRNVTRKRDGNVKRPPSPSPSPETDSLPSEDAASPDRTQDVAVVQGNNGSKDWSTSAAKVYLQHYPKAVVPKPMFKIIQALVRAGHGWGAIEAELDAYLRNTEVTYHNWHKFAAGFGSWATPSVAALARASPRSTGGALARSEAAALSFARKGGSGNG